MIQRNSFYIKLFSFSTTNETENVFKENQIDFLFSAQTHQNIICRGKLHIYKHPYTDTMQSTTQDKAYTYAKTRKHRRIH